MSNKFACLLIFSLAFGRYSCLSVNSEKYEELLTDIGRQFVAGLCVALDRSELLGVNCENEYDSVDNQNLPSYSALEEEFHPTVTVDPLGTIVGTAMRTYADKPFSAYMGIRFATANTFEMPVPTEEPWDQDFMGGYDGTYIRRKCPQISLALPVVTGDEDCLFLNIYTPEFDELNPTKTYPVMVYIYGGGFLTGDGSLYIPSRLLEEDVIVVVLQYRLGSLGFLYSGTTSAPGNMGLMDQVMALRWVNKYISYFGGDEENITVFGESAGAVSASMMQFTPQNSADYNDGKQLLNGVITQSGSALEFWALDVNYKSSLILHGEATGCYEVDYTPDDIVACMKELPISILITAANTVLGESILEGELGFYGITPVVQNELADFLNESQIQQYIVIPKHPLDMLEEDNYLHVNLMAGSNRDEGSLVFGAMYYGLVIPLGLENDAHFFQYEAIPLLVNAVGIEDTTGAVSNSFRLAFLPNADMRNITTMLGGIVDLGGMLFLKTAGWRLAQLFTRNNPDNNVFFYSFEFESDDSLFDWLFFSDPDIPIEGGVAHADDLLYLFALPTDLDDREKANVKKMTTLWSNFAYYGDPTPDSNPGNWADITSKWLPYSFDQENIILMQDDFVQSEDFVLRWNYNMEL